MTGDQASFGFGGAEAKKKIFPKPKLILPTKLDPSPEPLILEETQAAKSKERKRRGGRKSTILAGRMMAGRKEILKTKFGE